MGYPMTYKRVVNRNGLLGDYGHDVNGVRIDYMKPGYQGSRDDGRRLIAGDLRRLESDSRDVLHLTKFARYAGITNEQAKLVLDALFNPDLLTNVLTWDEYVALYQEVNGPSGLINVVGGGA